jgi:preprotein translocase subunit YajC
MSMTLATINALTARAATLLAFWLQPMPSNGPAPSPPAAGGPPPPSIWSSVLPLLAFVAFFYFFVIRPGNKQRDEQSALLKGLVKGDRVVTTGGMFGTVTGVDGDEIVVEIAERVKVRFKKEAIAGRVADKGAKKDESPSAAAK